MDAFLLVDVRVVFATLDLIARAVFRTDFLADRLGFLTEAFLDGGFLDAGADFLANGFFLAVARFDFGFPRIAFFALFAKEDTAPPTAVPAVMAASLVTSKPVAATPAPALATVKAASLVTSRPVAATSSPALAVSTIASLAVERTPSRSFPMCAPYEVEQRG